MMYSFLLPKALKGIVALATLSSSANIAISSNELSFDQFKDKNSNQHYNIQIHKNTASTLITHARLTEGNIPITKNFHIGEDESQTNKMSRVERKLDSISNYPQNWDGRGSPPFSKKIISEVRTLANLPAIFTLNPELSPTFNGTIQFEIEKNNREAEIEVLYKDSAIHYFVSLVYPDESISDLTIYDRNELITTINEFFAI